MVDHDMKYKNVQTSHKKRNERKENVFTTAVQENVFYMHVWLFVYLHHNWSEKPLTL